MVSNNPRKLTRHVELYHIQWCNERLRKRTRPVIVFAWIYMYITYTGPHYCNTTVPITQLLRLWCYVDIFSDFLVLHQPI